MLQATRVALVADPADPRHASLVATLGRLTPAPIVLPPSARIDLPPPAVLLVFAGSPSAALTFCRGAKTAPAPAPLLLLLLETPTHEERAELDRAGAESLLLWPCDELELAAQLRLLARLAPAAPGTLSPSQQELLEARDRLRATLAAGDVGIWQWYPPSGHIQADENLARFFAFPPGAKQLALADFASRFHPEDRDRVVAAVQATVSVGAPFDEQYRVVHPDGTILWLHARGRAESPAPGRPLSFAGVVLDVTARRAAQEAQAEAEQRFRALLEVTPDGFMIYSAVRDAAGEIVDFECRFANAAAEAAVGLGPRVGARLLVDQPGVREDGLFEIYANVVRSRSVWRQELHYRHEGIDGWFRCTAVPAGDGFAVSFTDITDRKRAEQRAAEEHGLLEAVLAACPAGIIVADATGQLLRANPANERIWGPSPMSRSVNQYIEWKGWWADGSERHGRRIQAHEWAMARALRGEAQAAGDVIDIEPFDEPSLRRTLINHGAPVRAPDGQIIGGVVVQTEITAWRRAEEELHRTEERFRRLADSMPQLVWIADGKGTVQYYNRRASAYSGIRAVPDGWEWKPVLHPEDEATTIEAWRRALATGLPYEAEHRLRMADGSFRWHLSRAFGYEGEAGSRQWFGTATDIDEQKRHQEILEQTVQERTASLQTALAELETFSYSLAHDLRSPLRALTGFSDLLLEEHAQRLDAEGRDMLRRVATAATRMDQLIRDVLAYSTISRVDTPLAPVDPLPLVERVVETLPALSSPEAELKLEPLPRVLGNEAMLLQIFSNLLGNAVKFTAPGKAPQVRVRALPAEADRVRLRVEDQGLGIEPEHHQRIFKIFQRLHASREGTGIGLSIVQKAAERMGGTVGVESTPGQGSTFWIELRRA